ncbi:AcrR family transcriptional regulator [Lipingzhangella halophila]|uniref:AcrR family transcriptional regulator n=1 Tax=Lipingzhangella halophila TaxID=1783352 RepID=A0A7W7RMD8_9ACTN|nr:AcrR family transcriptional regulator [Lipingzhangella halophila]
MTTSSASTTAFMRTDAAGAGNGTGEPAQTRAALDSRTKHPLGDDPDPSLLSSAPLRRRPAQQRSIQRVRKMLDACAELLDEIGYSELSTTRIADRAGVAIGSVYQFFPDKKAIAQALGLRYLDTFSARVTDRLRQGTFVHWTEAVDVIIDEYLDMHRNVSGFRVLHFGDIVDVRLLDANADNNRVIATRLRELLISIAGVDDSDELRHASMVAVEAADAVLKLAFRQDPDGDPRLIEETKLLIRGYLSRHFPAD